MTILAIPNTPAELEEVLNDPVRLRTLLEGPGQMQPFIQGYADAHARQDRGELSGQAGEQMTRAVRVLPTLAAPPPKRTPSVGWIWANTSVWG